tara:strand:+ start:593 stop:1267 length:675 start_codon:yes stop_codon:yes gene_type:complete
MKLSSDTLSVLQNFAIINNGIQVKAGSHLKTISPNKTLLALATVSETFEEPFCIYDLSQFLGTLSLFDSPELEFGENAVEISEGATHLKYVYADPNTIVTVPDKRLECDGDVEFDLPQKDLDRLQKAANILGLPNLVITVDDAEEYLVAVATDVKNSTSNNFKVKLTGNAPSGGSFKMVLKFDNLKLIPDDYHVRISAKGISHFDGHKVEYFVAVEQNESEFSV